MQVPTSLYLSYLFCWFSRARVSKDFAPKLFKNCHKNPENQIIQREFSVECVEFFRVDSWKSKMQSYGKLGLWSTNPKRTCAVALVFDLVFDSSLSLLGSPSFLYHKTFSISVIIAFLLWQRPIKKGFILLFSDLFGFKFSLLFRSVFSSNFSFSHFFIQIIVYNDRTIDFYIILKSRSEKTDFSFPALVKPITVFYDSYRLRFISLLSCHHYFAYWSDFSTNFWFKWNL